MRHRRAGDRLWPPPPGAGPPLKTGPPAADLASGAPADAASAGGASFVPDAAGVGTTLYAVPPGSDFRPLFGGASRARHAASGATELDLSDISGLRRDVDTPDDLRAAL